MKKQTLCSMHTVLPHFGPLSCSMNNEADVASIPGYTDTHLFGPRSEKPRLCLRVLIDIDSEQQHARSWTEQERV